MKLVAETPKVAFREYAKAFEFDYRARGVIEAYSDCLPEGVEVGSIQRELNYFNPEPFDAVKALKVLKLAIPSGYNGFTAAKAIKAIKEAFGDDCQIFIAREGSPCLYVKGAARVWFGRGENPIETIADEVSFDGALGLFRLWWD